jgi:hypothetical protein
MLEQMPTKQAYLAVHQTAELIEAEKYHKIKELSDAQTKRANRLRRDWLVRQLVRVLGSKEFRA